ncbi:MAG: hypothetical protein HYT47_02605 [Candidatus Vogelbacteria bacterium]|nr:hypothetical protein [Candidatus Vogelbacteria bacterium]
MDEIIQPKKKLRLIDKIILAILLLVFLFAFYITLDANKYRALVRVVEGEGRVGVNPTDQALDFGDLSRGTSAVRRVAIENGLPLSLYVFAVRTGSIRTLIKLDKNYFKLPPRSSDKIEFSVYMPASAEIDRVYDGRVYLFKIPMP